ncbi:MAG TPA: DinB family protein [Ignavibacteria bacterium]|nr:DinB family protein [Ignavibacteria bacterium]HMR41245.1 DinB family protein [Ignavibacteria bacterium]
MTDHYRKLFEYESWANNEIADCIAGTDDAPGKAVSLMSHIINAQTIWLDRLKNNTSAVKVWQEYNKDELQDKLKYSSDKFSEFLNTLSDKDLINVITYSNTRGEKFDTEMSDILNHLSHHSAYHRGQIITLMKPFLSDVPFTDYILYVRNIKK